MINLVARGQHVSRICPCAIFYSMTPGTPMSIELTAVFRKDPEGGFVAFVEELPGANSQGDTIEEARANLREAVLMVVDANRSRSFRRRV